MNRKVLLVGIVLMALLVTAMLSGCPKKTETAATPEPNKVATGTEAVPPPVPGEVKTEPKAMGAGAKKAGAETVKAGAAKIAAARVGGTKTVAGVKTKAAAGLKPTGKLPSKVAALVLKPGTAKCPVMGNVALKSKMIKYDWKGRRYYLCCAACVAKVKANPEKYLKNASLATGQGELIKPK